MADRRDGGYSRRGGDRAHHDNRDRHRDRDHDRRRDRDGDKEKRARDHGRDRDRDPKRYRSRSRDRDARDRRRSRSPREHDRRDNRDRDYRRRDEPKGDTRDREVKVAREDPRRLERVVDKPIEKPLRDEGPPPRRPRVESPRRSESPNRGFDRELGEKDTHLPTRSKPSTNASTPSAPVSFKVKGRDGSHGPERPVSRGARSDDQDGSRMDRDDDDDQHHPSRGRFDADPMDEDEEDDVVVEDDGLDAMAAMMGFGGFGSTKGKKILGNNVGAVKKEKKTEYRQYMNRVGGFNRPLSPPR